MQFISVASYIGGSVSSETSVEFGHDLLHREVMNLINEVHNFSVTLDVIESFVTMFFNLPFEHHKELLFANL